MTVGVVVIVVVIAIGVAIAVLPLGLPLGLPFCTDGVAIATPLGWLWFQRAAAPFRPAFTASEWRFVAAWRSCSMRGLTSPSAVFRNRARTAFQSASDSRQRVIPAQAERSSGTLPFVQAYIRSWVYAHPWVGVRVAVLTRKSAGYIGNQGRSVAMRVSKDRGEAGERVEGNPAPRPVVEMSSSSTRSAPCTGLSGSIPCPHLARQLTRSKG